MAGTESDILGKVSRSEGGHRIAMQLTVILNERTDTERIDTRQRAKTSHKKDQGQDTDEERVTNGKDLLVELLLVPLERDIFDVFEVGSVQKLL